MYFKWWKGGGDGFIPLMQICAMLKPFYHKRSRRERHVYTALILGIWESSYLRFVPLDAVYTTCGPQTSPCSRDKYLRYTSILWLSTFRHFTAILIYFVTHTGYDLQGRSTSPKTSASTGAISFVSVAKIIIFSRTLSSLLGSKGLNYQQPLHWRRKKLYTTASWW